MTQKLYRPATWLYIMVTTALMLQPCLANAQEQGKLTINADTITHEKKTGEATAEGSVVITYKERLLSGEKARYNTDTGDGWIEGGVVFREKDRIIYCELAQINTVTGLGELYKAKGNLGKIYFFSGEKIDRTEKERYLINNGNVTSCPQEKPHWSFAADSIDFTVEDYAWMEGVSFLAGGVPVFYLPYMVAPTATKRKTGFLAPIVGYSNLRGFNVTNAFFWAIAENMDATFYHKYHAKIGDEFDMEYRYIFSPETFGRFYAEYLLPPDDDQDSGGELWKIDFNHRHALPGDIFNVTRIEKESDYSMSSHYSENPKDYSKRYTDSHTTFTKSWDARNLTATIRELETTSAKKDETLLSAPHIKFSNPKQSIGGTGIYGKFDMSLVSYKEEESKKEPFEVTRVYAAPELSLPLTPFPWISITPSLGYRSAWYSALIDEDDLQVDESRSINFYKAGLTVIGPKFFRIFETTSSSRPLIKNLITPKVTWSYTPGYEEEEKSDVSVMVIDSLDRFAPVRRVKYQLASELLAKDIVGPESFKTSQIMRLSIEQSYDFNKAEAEEIPKDGLRPFSAALIDLDTLFLDWLMVNYKAYYDPYDEKWTKTQAEIGFMYKDFFHFALDRQYTWNKKKDEDSVWDTAYFELNMGGGVSFDYSIIYDETEGSISNSLLRAKYTEDCWSATLNVSQKNVTITDDNGDEKLGEESSVILTITLKGVGDIAGEKKSPLAGRKLRPE